MLAIGQHGIADRSKFRLPMQRAGGGFGRPRIDLAHQQPLSCCTRLTDEFAMQLRGKTAPTCGAAITMRSTSTKRATRSAVHAKFAVAHRILIQREQQAVSRRGDTEVPGHCQQRGEAIEIEQRQAVASALSSASAASWLCGGMARRGGSAITAVGPHCAATGPRHVAVVRARSTA